MENALNIFISLLIFCGIIALAWWIVNAALTFFEAGPKVRLLVQIIGAICLLVFLVGWFAGSGPYYFRIIK